MSTAVAITLGLLLFWWIAQGALVAGFYFALRTAPPRLLNDDECPPAAVILCLRGSDPFLRRCLEAVVDQDYPRFVLHVVVDHVHDPAWKEVEAIRQRGRAVVIQKPLSQRLATCSLKCSSVVQAVSDLDSDVNFIAQLDADTIPHRSWLRELATALSDDRVGAATGNRWYMPDDSEWGSLVRYAWNAAAVVQMYWYHIAWGGTLAIKTRVIQEANLVERWSHAFCEDTMLFSQLKEHGYRLRFVPSLMMVNREACDLPGCLSWVRRQLLTARLYHPGWLAVVGHGLGTSLALAACVGLLCFAIVQGDMRAAVTLAGGFLAYQLGAFMLLMPMEWAVQKIVRRRNEPSGWLTPIKLAKVVLTLPLTQALYAAVLTSACIVRRVIWRRASYEIGGPWNIRLVSDVPFQADAEASSGKSI